MTKTFLKICGVITGTGGAIGVLWIAFTLAQKVINPPLTEKAIQEIVQKAVEPLTISITDHLEATKTQQADFDVLESSYIDELKFIKRLDGVIKYYEDKEKAEKKAVNEKKNSPNSYLIPQVQNRYTTFYTSK
jgi:uncharacterized protein YneF (UPF0154 family)